MADQPLHRRPSWKQSRGSHRAYLEADFTRDPKPLPEMQADGDTFYYNPVYLEEWDMPDHLWLRLPKLLTAEIANWQAAGAAVFTAQSRIEELDSESLHRGWPAKTNTHLSRAMSTTSSVVQSPMSPIDRDVESLLPLQSKFGDVSLDDDFRLSSAVESPPFSPQDSVPSDEHVEGPRSTDNKPDMKHLDERLAMVARRSSEEPASPVPMSSPSMTPLSRFMTPVSRRVSSAVGTSASTQSMFDEAAWDVFINSYTAELDHLRGEVLVRFRHLGREVDKVWLGLKSDSTQPMLPGATAEFVAWWQAMMEKAQKHEKEAQALKVPDLEFVKMERFVHGLPV
ncbi:hypothetical protein MBLNU459_g7753t1 [Dothideomycetes sp. NU459]